MDIFGGGGGGGALFGLSYRSNNIDSLHKSAIGAELHGDSSFLYHQAAAGLGRKLVLEDSGIIWRFPYSNIWRTVLGTP